MIDYREMTVTIGDNAGRIKEFQVWWMTPFGVIPTLEKAKEKLALSDMPFEILRPIVVAMCDNGLYEPILG